VNYGWFIRIFPIECCLLELSLLWSITQWSLHLRVKAGTAKILIWWCESSLSIRSIIRIWPRIPKLKANLLLCLWSIDNILGFVARWLRWLMLCLWPDVWLAWEWFRNSILSICRSMTYWRLINWVHRILLLLWKLLRLLQLISKWISIIIIRRNLIVLFGRINNWLL
jgi:hypothetical protein